MGKLPGYLSILVDFRIERHKLYPLEEIIFLVISACICGSYDFEEIEDFGTTRLDYLGQYYPYVNGTTSHDTINRVLSHLDTDSFNAVFMDWVKELLGEKSPKVVNIDGKALCGTAPRAKTAKS